VNGFSDASLGYRKTNEYTGAALPVIGALDKVTLNCVGSHRISIA
jgi:hypothetical protein